MQLRLGAGHDRDAITLVEPRHQLGGALEQEVHQVHQVELLAVLVEGALDVELDLRDLARGQVLELRGQRVQLDAADGADHPHGAGQYR